MVTKELIEDIVNRVLEKLANRRHLLLIITHEGSKSLEPALFVKSLKELRLLYQLSVLLPDEDIDVRIKNVLRDFEVDVLERPEHDSWEGIFDAVEAVIVPALDQDTLARIALGLLDRFATEAVFKALYEGKKIILCPDGLLSKPGLTQGLRCFIEDYLQKARLIGCIISPLNEVARVLGGSGEALGHQSNSENFEDRIFSKKLLAAEDVTSLPQSVKRLVLEEGILITPLAWDQLRARGMEVVFRKGEGSE